MRGARGACAAVCAVALLSCSATAEVPVARPRGPEIVTETVWATPTARARDIARLHAALERHWYAVVRWLAAVERNELLLIASVAPTIYCIKAHESGDPTEHSHPGSGSGSEQIVPGTWRSWAPRAGRGRYPLAWLAPSFDQDYVTAYMLTHGGGGNWSNRFGNDPCTGL